MMLLLSFIIFFKYSELLSVKRDTITHETHLSIFIKKNKTGVYRQGHWFNLAKLN